ncbi:MAG: hypothetical protein IJP74_07455, partial [Prevotella sp.]|nr:hypothetical protein [Prevotella sp.]
PRSYVPSRMREDVLERGRPRPPLREKVWLKGCLPLSDAYGIVFSFSFAVGHFSLFASDRVDYRERAKVLDNVKNRCDYENISLSLQLCCNFASLT